LNIINDNYYLMDKKLSPITPTTSSNQITTSVPVSSSLLLNSNQYLHNHHHHHHHPHQQQQLQNHHYQQQQQQQNLDLNQINYSQSLEVVQNTLPNDIVDLEAEDLTLFLQNL
jgi:hypothetical protein